MATGLFIPQQKSSHNMLIIEVWPFHNKLIWFQQKWNLLSIKIAGWMQTKLSTCKAGTVQSCVQIFSCVSRIQDTSRNVRDGKICWNSPHISSLQMNRHERTGGVGWGINSGGWNAFLVHLPPISLLLPTFQMGGVRSPSSLQSCLGPHHSSSQ